MMKSAETVKGLESATAAVDAVRDLLGHVPNLEIGSVEDTTTQSTYGSL